MDMRDELHASTGFIQEEDFRFQLDHFHTQISSNLSTPESESQSFKTCSLVAILTTPSHIPSVLVSEDKRWNFVPADWPALECFPSHFTAGRTSKLLSWWD
jgi:hypothetical protein